MPPIGGALPAAAKTFTTALRPLEMHPFCLRHLPRRGGLLSAYPCANLSRSLYCAAKTSPSGGSTAVGGDRGAFPRAKGANVWFFPPERRFACFPLARQGGCTVLFILAAQPPTKTLAPQVRQTLEPSEPSEPSRRRRVLSTVSPQVCISSPPVMMTMAARWNQMKRTTRPIREP